MTIILVTWETENERVVFWGQPKHIVHKNLHLQNNQCRKHDSSGRALLCKCETLSSNSNPTKNKKRNKVHHHNPEKHALTLNSVSNKCFWMHLRLYFCAWKDYSQIISWPQILILLRQPLECWDHSEGHHAGLGYHFTFIKVSTFLFSKVSAFKKLDLFLYLKFSL
jgi:hypothetical protein